MNSRGFLTFAQNNGRNDYVRMAYALAISLRHTQRNAKSLSIAVTPGDRVPDRYAWAFDNIIDIPWGDLSATDTRKIHNEWKAIYLSPYDETIKLDADMLFTRDIEPWWDLMSTGDFCMCNSVVGHDARSFFVDRKLADVHAGFMFFKKKPAVYEHFKMAEQVFKDWDMVSKGCLSYRYSPPELTTDLAFSLALRLTDMAEEWRVTNTVPTFMQHDPRGQGIDVADAGKLTLGGSAIRLPVHHRCDAALVDAYIERVERLVGV